MTEQGRGVVGAGGLEPRKDLEPVKPVLHRCHGGAGLRRRPGPVVRVHGGEATRPPARPVTLRRDGGLRAASPPGRERWPGPPGAAPLVGLLLRARRRRAAWWPPSCRRSSASTWPKGSMSRSSRRPHARDDCETSGLEQHGGALILLGAAGDRDGRRGRARREPAARASPCSSIGAVTLALALLGDVGELGERGVLGLQVRAVPRPWSASACTSRSSARPCGVMAGGAHLAARAAPDGARACSDGSQGAHGRRAKPKARTSWEQGEREAEPCQGRRERRLPPHASDRGRRSAPAIARLLPAVMGEGLVGLRHLVNVFLAFDCPPRFVGPSRNLIGKALTHVCSFEGGQTRTAAGRRLASEPARQGRHLRRGPDSWRHLRGESGPRGWA